MILVYNNADGLEKTVQSILQQTYTNAEVIISDDGSSNYDTACLEEYAKRLRAKYQNVRVNINGENIGTVKHLNRVIAMAEGEYLVNCCAGDCFYQDTTVEDLIRVWKKSGKLIIATRRLDEYAGGRTKVRPGAYLGFLLRHFPKQLMNYMIRKKNLISGSCTFPKKELFEKYGPYDEDYHLVEDYPYYISLLMQEVPFAWWGQPSIRHEIGGVSTGRIHPSIYRDIEKMREKLYAKKDSFSGKTRSFLEEEHQRNDL